MQLVSDKYTIWVNRIYSTTAAFGLLFLLTGTSFIAGFAFGHYGHEGSKIITITDLKEQLTHEEQYREFLIKLNQLQQQKP